MSVEPSRRGRVILVGAGPGDPELITLRGLRALESADAVVFDALAAPDLLAYVSPEAERYNVGKRGHDQPTRPQPETTALLIELARAGKRVVRLKGGDPFVFGRGGEEASACAEAGIEFEVIPGVTSAVAVLASAGIPVTDRRHAASFAVVTGHKDPTKVSEETRWNELASAVDTLVVLMGMRKLDEITARLLAAGRHPDTPAAVVMNGTLPSQRVTTASLANIAARAKADGLAAPGILVVGDVVKLRESLAWFERRPLFGRRVLVTREESLGGRLVSALRDAGAEAIVAPMIRIAEPVEWDEPDRALAELADYDAIVITSANAVRSFEARARARGRPLGESGVPVWCVGPETARVTREFGVPVQAIPPEKHSAEGLLEALCAHFEPTGRRFLFPCAEEARSVLPDGLEAAGARVDRVVVYRTLPPETGVAELSALLAGANLDVLTFTSPSAVRNFAERLDASARDAAKTCVVAAIGPVTAAALRRVGFAPDVVSERADMRELVAAIAARLTDAAGDSR